MMKKQLGVALLLCGVSWTAGAQLNFADGSSQSTAGQPQYVSTVVVSPVGTDAQNGTALKNVYDATFGPTPVLIKVEPGVFDLGTSRIVLRSGISIEGSGINSTIIRSSFDSSSNGVLEHAEAGSIELSRFSLELGTPGSGIGIFLGSTTSARISEVSVRVTGAPTAITGIRQDSGTLELRDCLIDLSAAPGKGLEAQGASASIRGLSVRSNAIAAGIVDGIEKDGSCILSLRDSSIQLTNATTGFFVRALNVIGTPSEVTVSNTELVASGISTGIYGAIALAITGTVDVRNSRLVAVNTGGTALSAASVTGGIRVGASQVVGNTLGSVTLVLCYNGSFAAIP